MRKKLYVYNDKKRAFSKLYSKKECIDRCNII